MGRQTEDFGGYSLGDENNEAKGYERIDDSGLEVSAIKQRAVMNINEAATPIHLSQGSILADQSLELQQNGPRNAGSP